MCIIWWGGVVQAVVSSEDLGKEGQTIRPHHIMLLFLMEDRRVPRTNPHPPPPPYWGRRLVHNNSHPWLPVVVMVHGILLFSMELYPIHYHATLTECNIKISVQWALTILLCTSREKNLIPTGMMYVCKIWDGMPRGMAGYTVRHSSVGICLYDIESLIVHIPGAGERQMNGCLHILISYL